MNDAVRTQSTASPRTLRHTPAFTHFEQRTPTGMTAQDAPDGRWRERAACIGTDPKLFTDPQPGTDDTRNALAICKRCPVKAACLAEALHQPAHDDVGIWGATTEATRRAMRRGPTSQGQPTPSPPRLFLTLMETSPT